MGLNHCFTCAHTFQCPFQICFTLKHQRPLEQHLTVHFSKLEHSPCKSSSIRRVIFWPSFFSPLLRFLPPLPFVKNPCPSGPIRGKKLLDLLNSPSFRPFPPCLSPPLM